MIYLRSSNKIKHLFKLSSRQLRLLGALMAPLTLPDFPQRRLNTSASKGSLLSSSWSMGGPPRKGRRWSILPTRPLWNMPDQLQALWIVWASLSQEIYFWLKNTSVARGLPTLAPKNPFRIHLLGSWEGGICIEFFFCITYTSPPGQPSVHIPGPVWPSDWWKWW